MIRARRRHNNNEMNDLKAMKRRNFGIMYFIAVLFVVIMAVSRIHQQKILINPGIKKVNKDFDRIESALDRYSIDNELFPIINDNTYYINDLWFLTTPHDYIWDIEEIKDPFSKGEYKIVVLSENPIIWALIGSGPDKKIDFNYIQKNKKITLDEIKKSVEKWKYDPSNGISSKGDIIRLRK